MADAHAVAPETEQRVACVGGLRLALRAERADAARNRQKILEAARRLFAQRGLAEVTMEAVAAEAEVGKGTVFRRFGDRGALLEALLDDQERHLQEQILRGPPPLGPGAPAHRRLLAFVDALLALWAQHGKLLLASETSAPGSRYRTGAYAAWHQHTALLLTNCRPDADAAVSAHLLLATVDAQLLAHVREEAGIDHERLARALRDLTTRLTAVASAA